MSRRVETAFLPAALEIQEAPPSPTGRAILWTIPVFFVLPLAWAALSEVDIVLVAQGHIIPSGHSKTVQPLDVGTVRTIHVKEGQQVQAGDVLIELDTTPAGTDVKRLRKGPAMQPAKSTDISRSPTGCIANTCQRHRS